MDGFERARLKALKQKARNDAYAALHPEKKEVVPPMPVSVPQVMEVKVSGPIEQTFKVYYGGTIMASQMVNLPALIKKQLQALGRVE